MSGVDQKRFAVVLSATWMAIRAPTMWPTLLPAPIYLSFPTATKLSIQPESLYVVNLLNLSLKLTYPHTICIPAGLTPFGSLTELISITDGNSGDGWVLTLR